MTTEKALTSKEQAPPDVDYALTLMGCWGRDKAAHGPGGACRLATDAKGT